MTDQELLSYWFNNVRPQGMTDNEMRNYNDLIEFAKYYHEKQVISVDLADVGERKLTYNDGLRKELETLKEKRDAALSSSAIRYWESEIQRVKKRLYG